MTDLETIEMALRAVLAESGRTSKWDEVKVLLVVAAMAQHPGVAAGMAPTFAAAAARRLTLDQLIVEVEAMATKHRA